MYKYRHDITIAMYDPIYNRPQIEDNYCTLETVATNAWRYADQCGYNWAGRGYL